MTGGKPSFLVYALAWLMLIGLRAAHNEPATEEFLVVQFLHRAFGFLDGLHLDKRKTFRALVVPIAYDLRVLHVSNAVEQVEEIALGGVERQVANVETRRRDFNPFGLACRPRWLRTIARLCRRFLFLAAVSEELGNPLPKRLFLRLYRFLGSPKAVLISSASAPTARAAWASSG
jgi:hypothetical protein